MAKKRVAKMNKKNIEQIQILAEKIDKAIDSMDINPGEELEIFAESVALLITHWSRVSEWSPIQTVSYAGYVITNFMEKGIGAEIKHMEDFRKTILGSGRGN